MLTRTGRAQSLQRLRPSMVAAVTASDHSATAIREYFEDQLEIAAEPSDNAWASRISDGDWVDPRVFRARLTATRLSNPQVDHIYALKSARIQFIPFQFKPLLRLLRV